MDPNQISDYFAHQFWTDFFKYAFPLIFYTLHGWLATAMAIWALFHPYNPIYVPGTNWVLPCTPGIFPKRRAKLAQAVAGTITDTLLTTTDIKAQAENLVTEQNIFLAVDGFVEAVLKEFRDTTKLHRLAHDLSELSPVFLQELVVATVDGVEQGRDKRIATITEKIFDQVILSVRISKHQADEIAARIMESVITSGNIRNELIRLLSPENIHALEESIQSHASTPYKLLARVIGVKRVCYEWRNFLEKEPAQAEKIINDLLARFAIQEQIASRIANFDLRSMPLQTIAKLRQQAIGLVEEFMVDHREDILTAVKHIQGEAMGTVQSAIIRFNPASLPGEWINRAKHDMAVFFYSYLKLELGNLLERAIPALGVYGMIARKIDLFTPQQLEAVVKRICRSELKWLELLGAFIGFWLGGLQVLINIFVKYH
jgi:uncharacterized membrane protein YheB (UPF0754 family)